MANQSVPPKAKAIHAVLIETIGAGTHDLDKVKKVIRLLGKVNNAMSVNAVLQYWDDNGLAKWDKRPGVTGKTVELIAVENGLDAGEVLRRKLAGAFDLPL